MIDTMNRARLVRVATLLCSLGAMRAAQAGEEPKTVPSEKTAAPADADRAALIQGNTTFGLNLYGRLRQQSGPANAFLSPFSLSTALAMTAAGARGETARQMNEVLAFPFGADRVNAAFAPLIASLRPTGDKPAYALHTANALWGQRGYHFLPEYVASLRNSFGAKLEEVDFIAATEAARRTINTWVEQQTAGKIQDLIGSGILDAQTRLVLTNAIYFKGSWATPFRASATREDDFHVAPGRAVRVPLMQQTAHFNYAEDDAVQVLELPYSNGDLSMVVLLPKRRDGLAAVEAALSTGSLTARLERLQSAEVAVALPRFKLVAEYELGAPLAALGMTRAFSDRADFSGMNGGAEPLQISAVIHKAYVDVNEEGTEAAAATAVTIRATAAMIPRPPIPFRADHPFLFLIRDRRSGSVLFLGSLTQPGGA
jgi:serpin B